MYHVHPCFSLKNLGKNVLIMHGKNMVLGVTCMNQEGC